MPYPTMTERQLARKLRTHGSQMFTVLFRKVDNTLRAMTCVLHAHNVAEEVNKTGVKLPEERLENERSNGRFRVLDVNLRDTRQRDKKGAFRQINVKTTLRVRFAGRTFMVVHNRGQL